MTQHDCIAFSAVVLLLFAHLLMSEALFAGLADFYALPPLAVQDLVRCYSTLRGWVQDAVNNIAAARLRRCLVSVRNPNSKSAD